MEEKSTDSDFAVFREKLLNAKSKDKKGNEVMGGRYAVYDVEYDLEAGEGKRYDLVTLYYLLDYAKSVYRNKITFISWVPDDAPQYVSTLGKTFYLWQY